MPENDTKENWRSIAVFGVAALLVIAGLVLIERSPLSSNQLIPTPTTVTLRFAEAGLPSGHNWSVTVGAHTNRSNATAIEFLLAPGDYNYEVHSYAYASTPSTGIVNVPSSPNETVIVVPFTVVYYDLTLVESGLPPGTGWLVKVNNSIFSTNRTSLTLTEPAGNYSASVACPLLDQIRLAPGNYIDVGWYLCERSHFVLRVLGANATYQLNFSLALETNMTINQRLLPGGTSWYWDEELIVHRAVIVNFSFSGNIVGSTQLNVTAEVMTPPAFARMVATGNASEFNVSSGSVPAGNLNLSLAPSTTWYYVIEGPGVKYGYGLGFQFWWF